MALEVSATRRSWFVINEPFYGVAAENLIIFTAIISRLKVGFACLHDPDRLL